MGRIGLAFRIFWRTLTDPKTASGVARLLIDEPAPAPVEARRSAVADTVFERPVKKAPARSDALSLLAVLQREGRLVDFLQEPLASFSDAQIGAAVRDVHRDCAAVVERMFGLKPLVPSNEGAPIDIEPGFDAARFRLVGNVSGQPPYQGRLVHHGWQASRCEIPAWAGGESSALVIAPAEVELK